MVAASFQQVGERRRLTPRDDGEHVILSDCHDSSGKLSSQMAYINGTLDRPPQDIAIVATTSGQTAVWFDKKTEALFRSTGTIFTSTLNGPGNDGDFIGTGENSWGAMFNCYQNFFQGQYTWDGVTCNMVVDCNHSVPTATPKPTNSGGSSNNGLSTNAIIGISVGAGGACILIAVIAGWLLWRKYNGKTPKTNAEAGARAGAADDDASSGVTKKNNPSIAEKPSVMHELAAGFEGHQMTNETQKPAELHPETLNEVALMNERFSFIESGHHGDILGQRPDSSEGNTLVGQGSPPSTLKL